VSEPNDLKNKNLPGATHTFINVDDVDLMFYTGHGYARNRNETEGKFNFNSLHFGNHPYEAGTIGSANFTTFDAQWFGYNARTKWLVAYSCNFLNTAQADSYVYNMLDRGGRLILGLGTKSYIVPQEGTDFSNSVISGVTLKDAFFQAAIDNQNRGFTLSAKKYRVLYYGTSGNNTLNDSINNISSVEHYNPRISEQIVNDCGILNEFSEY